MKAERRSKSERLLSMLLLLQTRNQVSTTQLADELGVSVRTVLRDVRSLQDADVPVSTQRGRYGGVSILPGAQLDVTRLTPSEVDSLKVLGLDASQAEQLGLEQVVRTAGRKLGRRRGDSASGELAVSELVCVDNRAWFSREPVGASPAELVDDLRTGRRIEVLYRRSDAAGASWLVVDPYGLHAKAGRWYLVADADGEPRLFALERLSEWRLLPQARRLRAGHTLRSISEELTSRAQEQEYVSVSATLAADRADLAQRILGSRLTACTPTDAQRVEITVVYAQVEGVRQLLQFGDHLTVTDPPRARQILAEAARAIAAQYD